MKTKIVAISFGIIIVFLGVVFFVLNKQSEHEVIVSNQAKIVNPKYKKESQGGAAVSDDSYDSESFASLVDLLPTETLISSLAYDLDNDTYDDQIVVVRKADSRFLFIVVGVYDTETKQYERVAVIDTGISKTGTFAYSVLDMIGNHSQALIYQGYDDNDDYVMNIYLCKNNGRNVEVVNIGSFTSDGTIFVQQVERAESYALGLSDGESFSVWVYSSDKNNESSASSAQNAGLNQVQTEYKWNKITERFEFSKSTVVSAGRLAAKELSRIQDGTVETFANFMEGLWYKTDNTDNIIRYLYFDYEGKEVIFLSEDTEESYIWGDSKLRYNGIFITTSNSIITSLVRRFTISLTNVDEIRVSVRDEIAMNISESSLWDGTYKKTSFAYNFGNEDSSASLDDFISKVSSKIWDAAEQGIAIKFDGCKYKVTAGENSEEGVWSIFKVGSDAVIQFRPISEYSVLQKEYSIHFGTKMIEETVKKNKITKFVSDEDVLVLNPVKITPTEVFLADGKVIDFKCLSQ